jgi:hypothetical protein
VAGQHLVERSQQFGSILNGQVCSRTGPEHTLSRERIGVLGKGKYWCSWIKAPEFFNQLYPVSTAKPQLNHNQMRFVTQKQFAGHRRFVSFVAHHKLHALRNQ